MKKRLGEWSFSVSFSLFTFFSIILIFSFSTYFYAFEFKKNNVYVEFKEPSRIINERGKEIINYLDNNITSLDPTFFSEQAILHMVDVKVLINWVKRLQYLSAFFSLLGFIFFSCKKQWGKLKSCFLKSGFLNIGFVVLIFFTTFFSWDYAFTKFHHIMFSNELWLFDPSDNLIKMLPAEFFQDLVMWIGFSIILVGLIYVFLGFVLFTFFKNYVIFLSNRPKGRKK